MNTNLYITAHSGALGTQPNSMEYLRQTSLLRPDFIEVDVRKTHDGRVVLSHNPTLDTSSLAIAELPYEQLLQHEKGLLLLESALEFCLEHAIKVNLDIKEYGVIGPVCSLIDAWSCVSQVVFTGCMEREILRIHQLLPRAKVLYNAPSWNKGLYPDYKDYAQAMVETAVDADAFALNINYEYAKGELFDLARKRLLPIFVWTVEKEEQMRMMIGLGAASLTTKDVPLLRAVLSDLEGN